MFNNANVLFKTKFVDGVSTVIRTTPNQGVGDSDKKEKRSKAVEKENVGPETTKKRSLRV